MELQKLTIADYWQLPSASQEIIREEFTKVEMPATLPEYCWEHTDIEGGGGWTCGVCLWLLYGK